MKHTPGPWQYTHYGPDSVNQQAVIWPEGEGGAVAVVYDKRDMSLIAKAPELLELAKMVIAQADTEGHVNPLIERTARALVAEIEGGQDASH